MAKRTIRLETEAEDFEDRPQPSPKRRRFSRRRMLVVGFLLLMISGVFLPQIASYTSLGDWALRQFLPEEYGKLTVGQRNLAWWAPLSAGNIRLNDSNGQLLAEIGSLTTQETLWEILTTGQLTRVDIDQAAGRLDWRQDGSNWEDYLFPLLESTGSSSGAMADLEIHFVNSQALIESQTDDQRWMGMDLNGVVLIADNGNDTRIQVSGNLMDGRQNLAAGNFESTIIVGTQEVLRRVSEELQIQCQGPGFEAGTNQGGVVFAAKVEKGAASIGRSFARRYLPSLELNGLVTGKVAGVCNYSGDYVFVQSPKVIGEQLGIGDQDYLSGDLVQQRRLDLIGAFEMNPAGFVFQETRVHADFGRADFNGTADFAELLAIWEERRLPQSSFSTSGEVDIAQIANQLRQTLQLREGLKLDRGDLNWQVFNREQADGSQRLFLDAVARNLSGQLGTERLSWNQPIQMTTSLRDEGKPIAIENLEVKSHFLTTLVRPNPAGGGQMEFRCDFDQMKQALDQFFRLPSMTMQGSGAGRLTWTTSGLGQPTPFIESQLVLDLQNANLILPGVFELRDPNIAVRGQTRVELGSSAIATLFEAWTQSPEMIIRSGQLNLQTGQAAIALRNTPAGGNVQPLGDSPDDLGLTVALGQSVQVSRLIKSINRFMGMGAGAPAAAEPVLTADLQINGPLENWVAMVRPLLSDYDFALTGRSRSQLKLTVMDSFVTVGNIDARAQEFGFRGYGTLLQEPTLQLAGALSYHFDPGLIHIGELTLNSSTLLLRANQTRIRWVQGKPSLQGEIGYRANVYRLYQTLNRMQVAADENGVQLGMLPGGDRDADFVSGVAEPAYQSIQLVNYNAPVSPTVGYTSAALQFGGDYAGTAQFQQNESGETMIQLESALKDAWIGGIQPNGQLAAYVKEPLILIKGNGTLTPDSSELIVSKGELQSHRMGAGVAGKISQLWTQPLLNFQVRANAELLQWIRPFAGESLGDLQIDGLKQHQLAIAGPVDLESLQASWSTSWSSIGWMGLTGGPANVVLNLKQGILKMDPVRFEAGGGQVNLAPEVDLRGETIWVRLPQGMVFDEVQLTPKLCRNWLKYAAPLLAEVTSVQGTFSLDSDGIEVPLSDWTSMVAKARVTINGARVGPGPLGLQIGQVISAVKTVSDGGALDATTLSQMGLDGLSGLANSGNGQRTAALDKLASGVLGSLQNGQPTDIGKLVAGNPTPPATTESEKIWLDIPRQTVGLNLAQGGVEHEQLKMSIQGFQLVSNGRVGLDQSLKVNTTLKIPQEVLEKNPHVANALGSSVNLPITGTLTKPSLQSSQLRTALNTAISRGLQQAAGEQLEKKLGVPGLGELKSGSGNPLDNLIRQGQQSLGDRLNEKLNLPESDNPLKNLLPPQQPAANGSKPSSQKDPLENLMNQKLEQGLQKLFPGQQAPSNNGQ